jgi:hypothetical protein
VEAAGEACRRRCDARRRWEKGCERVSVRAAGHPCNFRKRKGLFAKPPLGAREGGLRDTYAVKRGERRKPVRSFISPIWRKRNRGCGSESLPFFRAQAVGFRYGHTGLLEEHELFTDIFFWEQLFTDWIAFFSHRNCHTEIVDPNRQSARPSRSSDDTRKGISQAARFSSVCCALNMHELQRIPSSRQSSVHPTPTAAVDSSMTELAQRAPFYY